MEINLSEHFTYKKLIKFTFPTIIMMVFTSIYGVVDGIFVSNVVGNNALASINLIMPAIMIIGTIGFMRCNIYYNCNCTTKTNRKIAWSNRRNDERLFNLW